MRTKSMNDWFMPERIEKVYESVNEHKEWRWKREEKKLESKRKQWEINQRAKVFAAAEADGVFLREHEIYTDFVKKRSGIMVGDELIIFNEDRGKENRWKLKYNYLPLREAVFRVKKMNDIKRGKRIKINIEVILILLFPIFLVGVPALAAMLEFYWLLIPYVIILIAFTVWAEMEQ